MEKQQITDFLKPKVKLGDEKLEEAVLDYIMEKGYRADYDDWEQWRFIKHATNKIWRGVKKLAEDEISPVRRDAIKTAFPKPKNLPKVNPPKKRVSQVRAEQAKKRNRK